MTDGEGGGETASVARDASVIDALRQFLAAEKEFSPVREILRQASEYRSSFALEELSVTFTDGRGISVMFKDLGWSSLTPAARQAKPARLYDPLREIEVYRRVLAGRACGAARCYGAIADSPLERYWLFIEKAPGRELYQCGDVAVWGHAARWLAAMHCDAEIHAAARSASVLPRLVRYDAAFFRSWIDRAVEFVSRRGAAETARPLVAMARRYDDPVQFLASLPTSFMHGEFYASNVLVDTAPRPARVAAVDRELAGIGPGVIDLAALVAGKWTGSQQAELIAAYQSGLPLGHPWANDLAAISHAVDFARLHLAVQWLGWSPDWTPPAHQAHDWLAEAVRLSEKLGLA